jgi:hypothetical protein
VGIGVLDTVDDGRDWRIEELSIAGERFVLEITVEAVVVLGELVVGITCVFALQVGEVEIAEDGRETRVQILWPQGPQSDCTSKDVSTSVTRSIDQDLLDTSSFEGGDARVESGRDTVDIGEEIGAVGGRELLKVDDANFGMLLELVKI